LTAAVRRARLAAIFVEARHALFPRGQEPGHRTIYELWRQVCALVCVEVWALGARGVGLFGGVGQSSLGSSGAGPG
jgi:hypothetical protein